MKKTKGTSKNTPLAPPTLNRLQAMHVQNLLLERKYWLQRLLDPRRDMEAECGHPEVLTVEDYKRAFLRGDAATRVVTLWPEESWAEAPQVFETEDEDDTEFEKAWKELDKKHSVLTMLERVDVLSGIGRFGILLIGIDDGKELSEPVDGINENGEFTGGAEHELLYLRAFDEGLITIPQLETNSASPRFGMPTQYQVMFEDANQITQIAGAKVSSGKAIQNTIHWSRVIHVTDNRTSSDVYGLPRMEKVFNRLLDLKKIAGGSGEMFWKGGFPGISMEAAVGPDENVSIDINATKEQMERYMNGLQRYLATVGMQARSLGVNVADPTPHADMQIKLISLAMSVPHRVFMGSEAAQLASEQDTRSWTRRVGRRRDRYLTPYVITPTVERFVALGILPEPDELLVDWPDLNALSDQDKATIAKDKTEALAKYVSSGADMVMSPFHYLTLVLSYDDDEAEAIIEEAEQQNEEREAEMDAKGLNPDGSPKDPPPAPPPGQPPARRNGNPRAGARTQRQPAGGRNGR